MPPSENPAWEVRSVYSFTGDQLLVFRAMEVRKEQDGVHAKAEVLMTDVLLGYDTFNVDLLGNRWIAPWAAMEQLLGMSLTHLQQKN